MGNSSGILRRCSRHASLLVSLNMFLISRRSSARSAGCLCLLGSAMKTWYCACALWTMNSSPPLTAIPYCPSGALILEISFLK